MHGSRSPLPRARKALAGYYREHGIMPSVQSLAALLGVTSTSSAHYVVQKLRDEGYLAANEHGKLTPGPLFPKAPGRPELPSELLKELPAAEGLQVLRVEEDWKLEEGAPFIPGDLLIVGPVEGFTAGDLLVLRRGSVRQVSTGLRTGWQAVGVLVGQYRAFKAAHKLETSM
jgi:hypothetical protein